MGNYFDSQEVGAYNGHFLLTLSDEIDMERLARAIEKAVAVNRWNFTAGGCFVST